MTAPDLPALRRLLNLYEAEEARARRESERATNSIIATDREGQALAWGLAAAMLRRTLGVCSDLSTPTNVPNLE